MLPVVEPPESASRSSASEDALAQQRRDKREAGRNALRDILFKRIDLSADLIVDDAVDALIDASGGVLRDFLYLLRDAALEADVAERECIEVDDVRKARNKLFHEYSNRIVPVPELDLTLAHINEVLGEPDDWPRRLPERTLGFNSLLQSLCILEYNGDRWYDLHPLVKEALRRRPARTG